MNKTKKDMTQVMSFFFLFVIAMCSGHSFFLDNLPSSHYNIIQRSARRSIWLWFSAVQFHPGVAKLGIALGSGPRGRGFKSRHSDHAEYH